MTLYERYRPRLLSDVVGQASIVKSLRGSLARGISSAAYYFIGDSGTGKETQMAKYTNIRRGQFNVSNCTAQKNWTETENGGATFRVHTEKRMSLGTIDAAGIVHPNRHHVHAIVCDAIDGKHIDELAALVIETGK